MNFIKDSTLVLYLPLYELDGVYLMSGDACGHVAAVNGAAWRMDGRHFDGADDHIVLGNPAALQIINNITVDLWVNLSASQNSARFADPISHGHNATRGWVFQFDHIDPANSSYVHMSNGGVGMDSLPYRRNLFDNSWHHLAASKSPANGMHIYLDGEIHSGNSSFTGDMVLTGDDVNIGRDTGTGNERCMTGLVGEVRIYNHALSPQEIQQNYLATKWRYV